MATFYPSILHIKVLYDGQYREKDQDSKYNIDYAGGLPVGVRRCGDWRRDCTTEQDKET